MYNIKKFVMGPLQSNSYIIWNDKKEAYLFDIGDINISTIINFIKENSLNLNGLFLTHGHIDHIWGVDILINNYPNIIVYIGDNEKDYLENSEYNLSYSIFREIFTIKNLHKVKFLKENDIINGIKVINTPGHTKGGVCYYIEQDNILISGDTLFAGSIGRTDFLGGNSKVLFESLRKICDILPEKTIVYSGHGMSTTIGNEKENLFGSYYDSY